MDIDPLRRQVSPTSYRFRLPRYSISVWGLGTSIGSSLSRSSLVVSVSVVHLSVDGRLEWSMLTMET